MTTQAQLLTAVVAALRPLVGNRVYTRTFLQPSGLPTWPAIRLSVVSAVPYPDACGDGGDEGADFRLQVDVAHAASAGETAIQTLRASVKAAMTALGAEYAWAGEFNDYDEATKTNRVALDYLVYLST
jgi:hypothetical protein